MNRSLGQLIMELEQTAREAENGVIQSQSEAAENIERVAEQLFSLAGRIKNGRERL